MDDLQRREENLLAQLTQIDSEASGLLLQYEDLKSQSLALRMDLGGVREEILEGFLSKNLTPLFLDFTIKPQPDDILVSLVALPEGVVELDKFKSATGITDVNNIPLTYILNYLRKGIPWSSREAKL